MEIRENYNLWLKNSIEDKDLTEELISIKNNEKEIYERFYKELEFGTAGLRGIIGAGTNRMNIYTVRLATQGLANYLNQKYSNSSVAISYDSRNKSTLFSKEAACVLAANNIKVYLTEELQPTPVLSFVVRKLGCKSGIMITASHNPAKYNGYKCYGEDGCQMTDKNASDVYSQIQKLNIFKDVKTYDFEIALKEKKIEYVQENIYEKYLGKVQEQSINQNICKDVDLKVVYSPLNGAGNKLVREIMKRIGVKNISVVKEQEYPDGNFPTCSYPNPEIKEALELSLKLAEKEKPDVVIATDPDSDRVGIAVNDNNNFKLMTGNEVGILLSNYILSTKKNLPENPVVVKTVVTSPLVDMIAENYKCELRTVLTGFKYIGEQILLLEKENQEKRFVFGFEESYGYLSGTYVRDKDAVVASMLICEMVAYYKKQNKNLFNIMEELYNKYGFYKNSTTSFSFEGSTGMKKMQNIMENLRNNYLEKIAGLKTLKINDYLESKSKNLLNQEEKDINLPKSNVLFYLLEGGSTVIVRPSGTEPKIKVYITSVSNNNQNSMSLNNKILENMRIYLK